MLVFLNGASFVGQASDLHHAGMLIGHLMRAVEHLAAIGAGADAVYRDEPLQNKPITASATFKDALLYRRQQLRAAQPQAALEVDHLRRFEAMLTALPLAHEALALPDFACVRDGDDVRHQALGYAAHFTETLFEGTGGTAAVLSLAQCAAFTDRWIAVTYTRPPLVETRHVWNVTQGQDVEDVQRTYEPHGKHDAKAIASAIGMRGSPIGLTREEAQQVLNQAVQLPDERRLFGRYNGQLYVFPCHDLTHRRYHGYRVDAAEFKRRQAVIYTQLQRHFHWPELR